MRVGGICGECGKYYSGPYCSSSLCGVGKSGHTLQIIQDIPEHYNRGLGMTIRGRAQYRAELNARGLTEVGNEKRYVSPEYNEKLQEAKREAIYRPVREKALRMMEATPVWN